MAIEIDDEVYEEFASEARERVSTIENTLVGMESSQNQGEDIKSIFRDIHTIKGNSHFLGIENIKELSHVFEDMFGTLRNGTILLSRDLIDVSLEAVDILGKMINDKTGSIECPHELVQRMRMIEEGKQLGSASPEPQPQGKVTEPAPTHEQSTVQTGALRVFQINPFDVIYLKLYKSLDHKAGELLSSLVFDCSNDGKTFIFDASYIVSVDEETDNIICRMTQEVDIFNSHIVFLNTTSSFRDSVCIGNDALYAENIGEALATLCRKAA